MSFVTEPLSCSLANLLTTNKSQLDELDIQKGKTIIRPLQNTPQKGFLQLTKALSFLHANSIIHGNLCPSSIYINSQGDWKVGGFTFSTSTTSSEFDYTRYPPYCSPSLNYLAPEYVLQGNGGVQSDVWSLGCVIYALYHAGESPVKCGDNMYDYKRIINSASLDIRFVGAVGSELRGLINGCLVMNPQQRISVDALLNSPFFDTLLISTIKFLDSFVEKTQAEKVAFLKGLVRVLPQFSMRLVQQKILPCLLQELKDRLMTPFILPCLFWVGDRVTESEFCEGVLPDLKRVFGFVGISRHYNTTTIYLDPPQALLLLLSRMDLFITKVTSAELFRQDVMPLIYSGLEIPNPAVQVQALKAVNSVLEKLESSSIKSVLFQKVHSLYVTSPTPTIRLNSLISVHAMLKSLDKYTIEEKVLPMLNVKRSREPGLLVIN